MKRFLAMTIALSAVGCSSQGAGVGRAQFGTLPKKQHLWYEPQDSQHRSEPSSQSGEDLDVVQENKEEVGANSARLEEINAENDRQRSTQTSDADVEGVVIGSEDEAESADADTEGLALKSKAPKPVYEGPDDKPADPSTAEACRKALGVLSEENFDVYEFGDKVVRKTDLSVVSEFALIKFNAEKRIVNATVELRNPQGKYCIDMSAGKVIRKVKITAACGARVIAVTTKANRVRNVTIDLCGQNVAASQK